MNMKHNWRTSSSSFDTWKNKRNISRETQSMDSSLQCFLVSLSWRNPREGISYSKRLPERRNKARKRTETTKAAISAKTKKRKKTKGKESSNFWSGGDRALLTAQWTLFGCLYNSNLYTIILFQVQVGRFWRHGLGNWVRSVFFKRSLTLVVG